MVVRLKLSPALWLAIVGLAAAALCGCSKSAEDGPAVKADTAKAQQAGANWSDDQKARFKQAMLESNGKLPGQQNVQQPGGKK